MADLFDTPVPVVHLEGGNRIPGNVVAPPAAECGHCSARVSIAVKWNFCPWCARPLAYGNRPPLRHRIFIEVGEGLCTSDVERLFAERLPEIKLLSRPL